jgi:hypothetical protein
MPPGQETQSENELLQVIVAGIDHLATDIHDLTRRLAGIEKRLALIETKATRADALLTEFEPVIRLYASPVSAVAASRRSRRARREATHA